MWPGGFITSYTVNILLDWYILNAYFNSDLHRYNHRNYFSWKWLQVSACKTAHHKHRCCWSVVTTAILIAHQLLWQNMEAPVSIFQESPLAGEPRERLFHIHSVHRYQLCTKHLYPLTLLWQMNGCNLQQQPGVIHWCYIFRCWKFNDVWLNIGVFCAPCIVERS